MDEATITLNDFMGRFGEHFFEAASHRNEPEYVGNREDLDGRLNKRRFERTPFPAQADAVKALYSHLYEYDAKMAFAVGEMGTGKTTVAAMVGSLPAEPQRVIVTVPPHLVSKWAREIKTICPQAKIISINSAGATRILSKAARDNPGRPAQTEFYIIGRVRLRMDYRVQSALNPKRTLSYVVRYACPCCGQYPVKKATFNSKDDDLPPEALMTSSADAEADVDGRIYVNIQPGEITRASKCKTVVRIADGGLADGCNAALWQAKRNHSHSQETTLIKGFRKLPGVGQKMAERLAGAPNARDAAETLENGDIPRLLTRVLSPSRLKRVGDWLKANEFSLNANDFAPVRFIHKRMPRYWFDLGIFDEVHELKGETTAQGMAYGVLAGTVRKVLCLTGTLIDGYAASLHPLLFRADPQRMLEAGYGAEDSARFQWEMGVVKEICIETETTSLKTSRARKRVRRQKKNLPGLHPRVVTDLLLPNAVFLTLADIEASIQSLQRAGDRPVKLLPSYREVYVAPRMEPNQQAQVSAVTDTLMERLKDALCRGGGKSLLGPIIATVLRYPDDCFRPLRLQTQYESQPLIERPGVAFPYTGYFPKVRFMIDLVAREMREGRRTVVYTTYTDRRDMASHYSQALTTIGADVRILRSRVPTAEREAWIEQQVKQGADVIICNPELVKTGLDLLAFPTMLFMQTGYVTDTILQASRRAWRIGQQQPVRVYFAGYGDSEAQTAALRLMAKKIRVANQAKGDVSESGLSVLDDDDEASAMQAMANAILDRKRDRSHDTITGTIVSIDEDSCAAEFSANALSQLNGVVERASADVQPASETDKGEQPHALPVVAADSANETAIENDGDEPTLVLVVPLKTGRTHKRPAQRVAVRDVPTGAQLALF